MVERETISITVDDKSFKFFLKPNIQEELRMRSEIAFLLGGVEKLSEFDISIARAFDRHLEKQKKIFGEKVLKEKQAELRKLADDKDNLESFAKLFNELHGDDDYLVFSTLQREYEMISDYAFLKVMCVEKPENYDFYTQSESELRQIVFAVRAQRDEYKKKSKN
jgi:hypothetical protein